MWKFNLEAGCVSHSAQRWQALISWGLRSRSLWEDSSPPTFYKLICSCTEIGCFMETRFIWITHVLFFFPVENGSRTVYFVHISCWHFVYFRFREKMTIFGLFQSEKCHRLKQQIPEIVGFGVHSSQLSEYSSDFPVFQIAEDIFSGSKQHSHLCLCSSSAGGHPSAVGTFSAAVLKHAFKVYSSSTETQDSLQHLPWVLLA